MTPRNQPRKLMSVRMISEEYGLPLSTAQALAKVIAREDGSVRPAGIRRVFFRREDVERRMSAAGAMTWR